MARVGVRAATWLGMGFGCACDNLLRLPQRLLLRERRRAGRRGHLQLLQPLEHLLGLEVDQRCNALAKALI